MDRQFKEQLCDFWEPWELVEFVRLRIEDVVDAFEDELEGVRDELEEFMGLHVIDAEEIEE